MNYNSNNVILPDRHYFQPKTITFEANFNVPAIGKYSFNTDTNKGLEIFTFESQGVYILDRLSVGGNISEQNYNDSIEETPFLRFKYSIMKENTHSDPVPIIKYVDDQYIGLILNNDKAGNKLVVDFTGILAQTAALVGVTTVKIIIGFSVRKISNLQANKFQGTVK